MLIVRSSILTLRWYDLETDCELLWVEVHSGATSLLFYRPHNSGLDYFNYLRSSIFQSLCVVILM